MFVQGNNAVLSSKRTTFALPVAITATLTATAHIRCRSPSSDAHLEKLGFIGILDDNGRQRMALRQTLNQLVIGSSPMRLTRENADENERKQDAPSQLARSILLSTPLDWLIDADAR